MSFRRYAFAILLLVLALGMAACGGGDNGGGSVNLSQTLTADYPDIGSFTLHYPEGWAGRVDGDSITAATSQEVMDKMESEDAQAPEKGEAAVTAMMMPVELLAVMSFPADSGPAEIATGFVNLLAAQGETDINLGDPETFDANGKPAAMVSGTGTERGQTVGVVIAVVQFDQGFGLVMLATHPDEVNDYKATARAMAEQFEFSPAQ